MKRHNLLAVLIFVVAIGGCAMLVEYGDADTEAMLYQPFAGFESSDSP